MNRTIEQYKEITANRMSLYDPSSAIDDILTLAALCEELRGTMDKLVKSGRVGSSPIEAHKARCDAIATIAKANEVLK